jgi:small subunit ribosomal protein S13
MARIEGVNLPANKRIEFGLTYIFGIGLPTAQKLLNKLHIDLNKRVRELTDDEVASIQKELNAGGVVEGDLRKEIMLNIKRLQETGSYRGYRHKRGLPVRGQRTRTNARSRKGPRKAGSQIALKKVVAKK